MQTNDQKPIVRPARLMLHSYTAMLKLEQYRPLHNWRYKLIQDCQYEAAFNESQGAAVIDGNAAQISDYLGVGNLC